ncbi:protein Skeletor, isoforms B/C-like isoform X2 [Paramacrobiotus metropolitanus]|uniref:protein Skeletor, isoforms B/C-like isoform X2 n=1 Tax=Paramacrobiotus metropolitanus TaxID=2943436 RepID=UPI0024456E28|nr:protein Skeletor, isoforms B/C-like isoform X2 [Paramacrobiotus metropolitanus]
MIPTGMTLMTCGFCIFLLIIFDYCHSLQSKAINNTTDSERPYKGRLIGKLKQIKKGELPNQAPAFRISGTLYAVDEQLLYIHDFVYDAGIPGMFLWAISYEERTRKENTYIIPFTKDCTGPTCTAIPAVWEENVLVALPRQITFDTITEFALATRKNDYATIKEKYASIPVPSGFKYPRPVIMPTRLGHSVISGGVSSRQIIVQDSRRIFIEQVTFDGSASDAFFWVDHGSLPTPAGFMVPPNNDETPPEPLPRLPKEPLTKYDALLDLRRAHRPGKTGNVHSLTVFDVKSVAIYDRTYGTVFGDAPLDGGVLRGKVPAAMDDLTVHRMSEKAASLLRDLHYEISIDNGIQSLALPRNGIPKPKIQLSASDPTSGEQLMSDDPKAGKEPLPRDNVLDDLSRNHIWNCEILDNLLEVQWKVQNGYITVTLSAPSSVLPNADSAYLAFGLSGSSKTVQMVGSDVTLGFVGPKGLQLRDFILGGKAVCNISDPSADAVCPRNLIGGKQISRLVGGGGNADGMFKFSYRRPLQTTDAFGKDIPLDVPVYVVWSIGPMNVATEMPDYHSVHATGNSLLHFGRSPENNCVVLKKRTDLVEDDILPPILANSTFVNLP